MLIISKFRDYYDTAIAFGVDKTIVYKRETKIIEDTSFNYPEREICVGNERYHYYKRVLGFCGEIYPIIEVITGYNATAYIYNKEDLLQHAIDNNIPISDKHKHWSLWEAFSLKDRGLDLDNFFHKENHEKYKEIFIEYKTPIFYKPIRGSKLIVNPNLKEYGFVKIKDPFTAFQDIMQYISGVLGVGEQNMVEISNEDMRDKKGFDSWSFRKHKLDNKKSRKK